jgi:predicted nucleic acid-binding protein
LTPRRVVLTDTNVLLNLAHVDRLDLLAAFADLEFCVPSEVLVEVRSPVASGLVSDCLQCGRLREVGMTELADLALFSELRQILGIGEAACLALAVGRTALIASDEKRAFRREVLQRLGPGRLLTTPGLLLLAIRRGMLTIDAADDLKLTLERHRFKMSFRSFNELT